MKKVNWIIGLIFLFIGLEVKAESPIQIFTFGDYSRFILKIDKSVGVDTQKSDHGIQVLLKGVGLEDLGSARGEEARWKSELEHLEDVRVQSLDFRETPAGTRIGIRWRFPKGEQAPAYPKMEYFGFYDDLRSQYVIDFWIQGGPTRSQLAVSQRRDRQEGLLRNAREEEEKRVAREKIRENEKYASRKFIRFCQQPLGEKNDIFLAFLPIHEKVDFSRWFSPSVPDLNFDYRIPTDKSRESQYVRLAHSLFEQGNLGLSLRTIDFFNKEFPLAPLRLEMKFFQANALMRLGLKGEGQKLLEELARSEGSEVALHASAFLALQLMEKRTLLPALEHFTWLIQNYPRHKLTWVFHLGAAECLYGLKQTDRAGKEYQWIIEKAGNENAKGEAAFRLGDLYLDRFQYEHALLSYFQAYKHFPAEAKKHPSYALNRAEVLYQLEQFAEAKKAFEVFLQEYPNYPEGWRASFRLGEIAARKDEETSRVADARGWYYQTINRFPFSPGALLARLRLLPCEDHAGFTALSMETFFRDEVGKFAGEGTVQMEKFEDFQTLAYVRGLMSLGTSEQVSESSIRFYWKTQNPTMKESMSFVAHFFFGKTVLDLLKQGKKFQALIVYGEQFPKLPKQGFSADDDYLLKLSQAASDLGLGKFGARLSALYEQTLKSQKGMPELDTVEAEFSQAKALWVTQVSLDSANAPAKDAPKEGEMNSRENLGLISKLLSRIDNGSPFSFEKEVILGLIDEKENRLQSALGHAARAQLLGGGLRVDAWLAELELKVGDLKSSLDLYRNLERVAVAAAKKQMPQHVKADDLEKRLGLAPVPSLDSILTSQGAILEKQGRWGEAATTYARAVENGQGGERMVFQYAKMLLKTGKVDDRDEAHKRLEKIVSQSSPGDSSGFWRRLAQETLEDEKKRLTVEMPRRAK